MSRTCYSLPAPTRDEATRWLQRKLAMVRDEGPPPKPRPLRAWLAGALRIRHDELQPGLAVAVRLADGSLWLGEVREVDAGELVLAPWGASRDMTIGLTSRRSRSCPSTRGWSGGKWSSASAGGSRRLT